MQRWRRRARRATSIHGTPRRAACARSTRPSPGAVTCRRSCTRSTPVEIACYVGRTGVLTPVAHVTPVIVGGVTVRNVTMHNEVQVNEKGVYVGARVVIHRAGDVIPEIVSVVEPKQGWRMPAKCPVCGGEVVREEPYIAHRCINPFCGAQQLERL